MWTRITEDEVCALSSSLYIVEWYSHDMTNQVVTINKLKSKKCVTPSHVIYVHYSYVKKLWRVFDSFISVVKETTNDRIDGSRLSLINVARWWTLYQNLAVINVPLSPGRQWEKVASWFIFKLEWLYMFHMRWLIMELRGTRTAVVELRPW